MTGVQTCALPIFIPRKKGKTKKNAGIGCRNLYRKSECKQAKSTIYCIFFTSIPSKTLHIVLCKMIRFPNNGCQAPPESLMFQSKSRGIHQMSASQPPGSLPAGINLPLFKKPSVYINFILLLPVRPHNLQNSPLEHLIHLHGLAPAYGEGQISLRPLHKPVEP